MAPETQIRSVEERGANGHGMHMRIAERVHVYGDTLEALRDRLEERGSSQAATYLDEVVTRVERISVDLRDSQYREAAREMRRFAAAHPELFLGISFVAGALIGRFINEMGTGRSGKGGPAVPTVRPGV